MRGLIAASVAVAMLAGGCTSAELPPPTPIKAGLVLLAATDEGAVAVDRSTNSLVGFDRSGSQVWSEPAALKAGATFACLRQCPDAILSYGYVGQGPDRAPKRVGSTTVDPLQVSKAHHHRVLAARSADDMVIEETDEAGRTTLRLVGPGQRELSVEVSHQDQVWLETVDRSHAMAFTRIPGASGATIQWFTRDASGWRPTGDALPRGTASNGCLGDGGAVALIAGRSSALIVQRQRRVELRVDLHSAGECGIGPHGGVVVGRSISGDGQVRTAVRGIDLQGSQTWARDFAGEALIAAEHSGARTAIAYNGILEILDTAGNVAYSEPDIGSALFAENGELVVATLSGKVRRLPPTQQARR
ncbi:hypothetical protein [Allorhizocola rhizosphaerae]|uniref:hypothetical protein n=1 Tax=Allorhizocola rhizosphaerae TaxID=1872709 RepID=UPI000E3C3B80|nr:hypothetical protein [Allorhizocola rhizosphaerae]